MAAAVLAVALHPDTRQDVVDTAVAWLHLPVLAATAAAVAATLETYPAFGRDRPDAGWIRRLGPGRLDGSLVAAASTVAVLALCLLAAGIAFETLVRRGPPATIVSRVPLLPAGEPRLDPAHRSVELRSDAPVAATDAIELRPLAAFTRGGELASPQLRIRADARELGVYQVPPGGGLVRIPIDGARVEAISVTLEPGERAVVLLPEGAAHLSARTTTSATWNAAAAALSGVFAAALALSLAILGRRSLSTPVLHVLALAVVLLGTASDLTPVAPAIAAHARDLLAWGSESVAAATRTTLVCAAAVGAAALLGVRRATPTAAPGPPGSRAATTARCTFPPDP